MIRAIIGIFIVPALMFQMAGGVRTAWPGMLLTFIVGLVLGHYLL